MDYYKKIKEELINNEVNRKVKNYSINRSDLTTYYNVGKMLAGKMALTKERTYYGLL